MRTDGRTDGRTDMTKQIVAFPNFAKAGQMKDDGLLNILTGFFKINYYLSTSFCDVLKLCRISGKIINKIDDARTTFHRGTFALPLLPWIRNCIFPLIFLLVLCNVKSSKVFIIAI